MSAAPDGGCTAQLGRYVLTFQPQEVLNLKPQDKLCRVLEKGFINDR